MNRGPGHLRVLIAVHSPALILYDNLAWTVGSHDLRFGTNSRIFRLNDYDFGAGVVPLVNYATLPQFIYGVASTASTTFPLANSQPYNFLNLDFYAQDTWKVTRSLTWTFGVRDTYNSNPLIPHHAVAAGCLHGGLLRRGAH